MSESQIAPSLADIESRLSAAVAECQWFAGKVTCPTCAPMEDARAVLAAARPLLETLYALDAECPLLGQPAQRRLAALLGKPHVLGSGVSTTEV